MKYSTQGITDFVTFHVPHHPLRETIILNTSFRKSVFDQNIQMSSTSEKSICHGFSFLVLIFCAAPLFGKKNKKVCEVTSKNPLKKRKRCETKSPQHPVATNHGCHMTKSVASSSLCRSASASNRNASWSAIAVFPTGTFAS